MFTKIKKVFVKMNSVANHILDNHIEDSIPDKIVHDSAVTRKTHFRS